MLEHIALTLLPHLSKMQVRQLVEAQGNDLKPLFGEKGQAFLEEITGLHRDFQVNETRKRAEEELRFIEKNHIRALLWGEEDYPQRLRECPDAPAVIYGLGQLNLNNNKPAVSIVGTRKMTDRGRENCERLVEGLAKQNKETLIVSGLAYGSDICAHRAALKQGIPTVAVMAHGLDQVYPKIHRQTAVAMLEQGGLLTEYPSGTPIHQGNFLQRNRLVAGLSDCTVVVESFARGGSLSTASYALGYGRTIFAFPGRVGDSAYEGCNKLIKSQRAALLENAEDLYMEMGWNYRNDPQQPQQKKLFYDLTPEEQTIIDYLQQQEEHQAAVNTMVLEMGISYAVLISLLLQLEFKSVVISLPGGLYRLSNI